MDWLWVHYGWRYFLDERINMLQCVRYDDSLKNAWQDFAHAHASIFHSLEFRNVLLESFGYSCLYHLILDEQKNVCALLPLVSARNLGMKKVGVSLPFLNYLDICATTEEALNFAMASLAEVKKIYELDYLELRLKETVFKDEQGSVNLNNFSFLLPLEQNEEDVLKLSTGSNRNHVRKVYRKNYFTVSFDKNNLPDFYKVYVRRMKELGSPAPDIIFFEKFFTELKENVFLLTVLDNENQQVVGGMLLVKSMHDKILYYPYGANLVEYNNKYLNNFMYWEAVKLGIRLELDFIDLGRSPLGSGTYKYKEQWGAKPVQLNYVLLGAAGHAPPNKDDLNFLVELWKKIPAVITNFVGKKIIKYVLP